MTPDLYFADERLNTANRQAAAFAQVFYTRGNTIPSIGLRYDRIDHGVQKNASRYDPVYGWKRIDSALLPWFGVTRILGKWSVKALYGRSFRAPTFENFDMNPALSPEITTTGEVEIGYQAGENAYLILDLFRTRIKGPIIYFYDPETNEESYGNYKWVGSQGVEIESRWKADWGYWNASYSFYRPIDRIASYRIEGHPEMFLGLANHKASLSASYEWGKKFSLNPTLAFYGTRYGYTGVDAEENHTIGRFKPSLLANLCLQADRVCGTPVDASLAVYNALDADVPFIQPYDGGHAPLPSQSREFILSLRTRLQW
jgi:outer membrane receptor for ferrienterochelin and colicins